ncbi:carbohydrate-binding protein [Streptosporangium sp. NPDC000239]|uniref:carbohydrate-binding protein n=1 Tax=unclassified Streptosporangium TaxID=2632669 RepID=UPI0033334F74
MRIRRLLAVLLATALSTGILAALAPAPAIASTGRQASAVTSIVWMPYWNYEVGDLVYGLTNRSAMYRCLVDHFSMPEWAPEDTPALWQRI